MLWIEHLIEQMIESLSGPEFGRNLLLVAIGFLVDAGVRRSHITNEFSRQHREIWIYHDDQPDMAGLKDPDRNMAKNPLSQKESHFVGYVLNHIFDMYRARRAWIFPLPESLSLEIRELFSYPAMKSAWNALRPYQDKAFVRFVEKRLRKGRATQPESQFEQPPEAIGE